MSDPDTGTLDELIGTLVPADLPASATIRPEAADGGDLGLGRPGLSLGATLGEGGMGVVRRATQRSLDREVAVKEIRGEARSDRAVRRLALEAWVTGILEHPNILPVHDLVLAEDGSPRLVMKRVDGRPWSTGIRDEAGVRDRFGARRLLDWNLGVLLQVCAAVDFAHSRGVLHRDLKPENVMIGPFGEVYVLDWGVAAALDDRWTPRLERPEPRLVGTPRYMAPEMAVKGGDVGVHSDVYLLGAVLYEIATGHGPHGGDDLATALRNVREVDPEVPPTVAPELGGLLRRTLARDPSLRPASAAAFRTEIQAFLDHRASVEIAAEARDRLRALELAVRREEPTAADGRERVRTLWNEVRFTFRLALRTWPENRAAAEALAQAAELAVAFELEAGDVGAAEAILADLADPPLGTAARVRDARARADADADLARRLLVDRDRTLGIGARIAVAAVLGGLFTAMPLVTWARAGAEASYPRLLSLAGLVLVVALGFLAWGRRRLWATSTNRAFVALVLSGPLGQGTLDAGAWLAGVDVSTVRVFHPFLWSLLLAFGAVAVDARLAVSSVTFLAAFGLTAARPDLALPLAALGNVVLTINAVGIWLLDARSAATTPTRR